MVVPEVALAWAVAAAAVSVAAVALAVDIGELYCICIEAWSYFVMQINTSTYDQPNLML